MALRRSLREASPKRMGAGAGADLPAARRSLALQANRNKESTKAVTWPATDVRRQPGMARAGKSRNEMGGGSQPRAEPAADTRAAPNTAQPPETRHKFANAAKPFERGRQLGNDTILGKSRNCIEEGDVSR